MKQGLTRKTNVRMPKIYSSSSSSTESLPSRGSGKKRKVAPQKTIRQLVYVARIDHLHYGDARPPEVTNVARSAPAIIDTSTLGWGQWLHYQCKKYAWVGQGFVALVIFVASRISLGFGVRLNSGA